MSTIKMSDGEIIVVARGEAELLDDLIGNATETRRFVEVEDPRGNKIHISANHVVSVRDD